MERRKEWDAPLSQYGGIVCFILHECYAVEFIKGGKVVHFHHVF